MMVLLSGGTTFSTQGFSSITSNNSGLYVAVSAAGNNVVAGYSVGGFVWSSGTMTSGCPWRRVTYAADEGVFYAHSATSTIGNYSYDGNQWLYQVAIAGAVNDAAYTPLSWRSADSFTLVNGATVTTNTDQKKSFPGFTITNGVYKVENTSTSPTGCIRFTTGRTSTAQTYQYIAPQNGLGSVLVSGTMVTIGVGSGTAGQIINTPYTDYIPSVWVETGPGSGTYEIWNNVLTSYGKMMDWPRCTNGGLDAIGTGESGKHFTQIPNPVQDRTIILTGCSGNWGSRMLWVPSGNNILTGASVSGSVGIVATTIVERIINPTLIELNTAMTVTSGNISIVAFNPWKDQLLGQIKCGDGIQGNVFPSGCNIQIPNIMGTTDTPANFQTNNTIYSMNIYGLNSASSIKMHNVLFDDAYHNLTQTQVLDIKNNGYAVAPLIVETYGAKIDGMGVVYTPMRRFYSLTNGWTNRDGQNYAGGPALNGITNISDATINNLKMSYMTTNYIAAAYPFKITAATNVTMSNVKSFIFSPTKPGRYMGLTQVYDSTFDNIEYYGHGGWYLSSSSNNRITNCIFSNSIFNETNNFLSTNKICYDPSTGLDFIEGQKYYFKMRSYYTKDGSVYTESRPYSATPFLGAQLFPDYFGCCCNGSQSVVMSWTNRSPVYNYEIYRGTTPGFATRDFTTKIFENIAGATVTWTNNARTQAVPTAGTDTWTWAAAGKTLTRSNGGGGTSFLTLGYVVGDVVDITSTLNNNGTKVITAVTATVMTFANVGDDVQTVNAEAASTVGAINGRVPVNGTTYYYVFRKYDSTGVWNESTEHEVYVSAPQSSTNLVLMNQTFDNAAWTKTRGTVTASYDRSPTTSSYNAIAIIPADKFAATSANGNLSQAFTTVSGQPYTFSVFVRNDPFVAQAIVSGYIGLSGSAINFPKTNFALSGNWQRPSVTITASGVSTTAFINVNTNADYIVVDSAMCNSGVVAEAPLPTLGTTYQSPNVVHDIASMKTWCRSYGGNTKQGGVEFTYFTAIATAPSGIHYSEMYCGTSGTFEPSRQNCIFGTQLDANYGNLVSVSSNNNLFSDFTQVGRGGLTPANPWYYTDSDCAYNTVKNITLDLGCTSHLLASFAGGSNNQLMANWTVKNPKTYTATSYPITAVNTSDRITVQNIDIDRTDTPFSMLCLNMVMKGWAGCNLKPANGATQYILGSTTDGMGIVGTSVYGSMFSELYHSDVSGALHINFNDYVGTKPFTLFGTAQFSNTARLYTYAVGDGIEITWPHKILGVSGFSADREPGWNGLDLGSVLYSLIGVSGDYRINTGAGYPAYKTLNAANLSSEVVSPVSGFYMQIKVQCTGQGMKYGARTNDFVVGERIRDTITGATANVVKIAVGTTLVGDILLSNISGVFGNLSPIVRDSDSQTRATNVLTGTQPLWPAYTSYIDALEIYTLIDKTVKYPIAQPTLTLTGLQPGTRVDVLNANTNTVIGEVLNASGTASVVYDYYDNDIPITVKVNSLGYQNIKLTGNTLPINGLSIPVVQQLDRQYNNP
jgi:hypothetical protein